MSAYPIPASPPSARLTSIAGGRVSDRPADYETNGEQPSPGEAAGGERHLRIPDAVWRNRALSRDAILLYGILQGYTGPLGCFPGTASLQDDLRCSRDALYRWLHELQGEGFLTWDRGGGRKSNQYTLHPAGDGPRPAAPAKCPANGQPAKCPKIGQIDGAKCPANGQLLSGKRIAASVPAGQEPNVFNQNHLTRAPAPTERGASAPPAGPSTRGESVGDAEAGTPAPPPKPPAPKAAKPPPASPATPTALQRVEQGIKAAGVRVVMDWGRDGKQLAALLANTAGDVGVDDVIGCYVAVARHEYGDDFMRRNLSVAFVCTKAIGGYLIWRENGATNATTRQSPASRNGRSDPHRRDGGAGGNPGGPTEAEARNAAGWREYRDRIHALVDADTGADGDLPGDDPPLLRDLLPPG